MESRLRKAVCAALLLVVAGCGEKKPVVSVVHGTTAAMRDTLAALYARAIANPMTNPFLNRERVAVITGELAALQGDAAMETRYQLAEELLKAGRTQDAIDGLERLIKESGISWDSIAPRQKPFFDMLGVAYMRLGEQQNCLTNPAANICILPLAGGARHTRQDGARGAIARYTKMLRQYPDDRGSQWLLNLAYLQIGNYPDSVPSTYLITNLVPKGGGTAAFPEYRNIAGVVGLAITGLAGGTDVDDFNGDGLLDVFATGWGLNDPVHLFLADGKGGFADRTAQAGLTGIVGGLNTIHADYDNDGDEDILILRGAWMRESGNAPMSLLRNKGDGTFEDVTIESGLLSYGPTNSAAWGDFNLDGRLDLFVGYESYAQINGGRSHRSKLFLGNADGTFTDVAMTVGINVDEMVKGVAWGDVNNDGWPDLFLSVIYGRNKLFINKGGKSIETWKFEEQGAAAGVQLPLASFPTWFWDYNNDGNTDLFVPSYDVNAAMHEFVAREYLGMPLTVPVGKGTVTYEDARLYRNKGDGTFEDVTAKVGLSGKVMYAMGSNFGDLDNDGYLDFYIGTGNPDLRSVIPNRMFRSVEGKRFEEVTLPGGFGHLQKGHAVAFADFDRDGDEDVFTMIGGAYQGDLATSVLFENPGWPKSSWINLQLEGRAANRSAIGARVEIVATDATGASRSIFRTIGEGGSFGAGPVQLHVGLGAATSITSVRVRWPDMPRTRTAYANLAVNTFYRITQGAQPVRLDRPAVPFRKSAVGAPASLTMPMPMPK